MAKFWWCTFHGQSIDHGQQGFVATRTDSSDELMNEEWWMVCVNGILILSYTDRATGVMHPRNIFCLTLNSSPPSATYMRQCTRSTLVLVIACRLFGAKPLLEPMLTYCQLDYWKQTSVKFKSKLQHFLSRKCTENVICKIMAILSRGRWVKRL